MNGTWHFSLHISSLRYVSQWENRNKIQREFVQGRFLVSGHISICIRKRGPIMALNSIHTQCTQVYKTLKPNLKYLNHPISKMQYSSTSERLSHRLDKNVNIALYLDCYASRPDVLRYLRIPIPAVILTTREASHILWVTFLSQNECRSLIQVSRLEMVTTSSVNWKYLSRACEMALSTYSLTPIKR